MTRADFYREKAEQFELMARNARAETTRSAYRNLARSYRQLGIHVDRSFDIRTECEGLSAQIVGGKKNS